MGKKCFTNHTKQIEYGCNSGALPTFSHLRHTPHTQNIMKTHLPVLLRKALLAAIVAVSTFVYNQSFAADIGNVSAANQNYTVTGDENITVGVISETADNLTLTTESGDVTIEAITTSQYESVDGLSIVSGGTVSIGESRGHLSGAGISADGNITIGEGTSTNLETKLTIDSETGPSTIATRGDLFVKQSLDIQAAGGEAVKITSAGKMDFSGVAALTIGGDSDSEVLLQAGGPISMRYQYGTNIGEGVKVETTGDESDVVIEALRAAQTNELHGSIESSGTVSMTGSSNTIWNESIEMNSVCAKNGIDIYATGGGNVVKRYALSTESGGIMMRADALYNSVSSANLSVTSSGNVEMQGGEVMVSDSKLATADGSVKLEGKSASVSNTTVCGTEEVIIAGNVVGAAGTGVSDVYVDGMTITIGDASTATTIGSQNESDDKCTTLDASAKIVVKGATVTVSGDTAIESTGGNVEIEASTGVAAVRGGSVAAAGEVKISGAGGTTVSEVDVDCATIDIGAGGTTQVEAGTTLDATSAIDLKGQTVNVQETIVTSKTGNVTVSGTESNGISDSEITAERGELALVGANSANSISGSIVKVGAGVRMEGKSAEMSVSDVSATQGNVRLAGTESNVIDDSDVVAQGGSVILDGDSNRILGGSGVQGGGNVHLTAGTLNVVANSSVVTQVGSIEMNGDSGVLNKVTSCTGDTKLTAAQAVQIVGKNIITSETSDGPRTLIQTETGDVFIKGDNDIRYATLAAKGGEGDVYISTGTGDSMTRIEDSGVSGETVTIEGDITERSTENLAVVTGGQTTITARGEDEGAGIRLNNVSVEGVRGIEAQGGGHILIMNRVDVENATLTIAEAASSVGRIVVDAPAGRMVDVLNMKVDSHLGGRLSGRGHINKSGGDALLLALDHTDFHGSIFANGATGSAAGGVEDDANTGSWIDMNGAGVGTGTTFVLKNTDLVVTADGVAETQIGSLDTTQDSEVGNNAATGGTLFADGSYTMDDNLRADFRTVGSVLDVNADTNGDVLRATNLRLSDATLIKLDAAVDAAGQVSSDRIVAGGTIHTAASTGVNSTSTVAAPSTARVYVYNLADAAHAAEGARTTILEGRMATNINEDVLYEVTRAANGTYQRVLQERNVHLENKGDRVELVFSKNYRSAAKTPMQQSVADALLRMSDAMDHSEGTLAAKGDLLSRVIDAFDYTRSEDAALRGLQSLVGTDMTLAQYMMLDSSRHHINNLRRQITLPERCTTPQYIVPGGKGGLSAGARKSHVWGTYVGASDSLDGDENMGDYSRSSHGFMLGYDATVRSNLRLGLSFGYDSSKGSTDFARMDSDTLYADLYASARTGRWNHRASAGVAVHDFSTQRDIRIDAGYHTLVAHGKGKMEGFSVNLGYELSTDIALTSNSCLTPYLAANVAFHSLDSLRENELGSVGMETRFDDVLQADVALGVRYSLQFAAMPDAEKATFVAGAAVHVDMTEERMTAGNRFVGIPVSWDTKGMRNTPVYFELGLGLDVPLNKSWTATAGTSLELGGDRTDFSGNIGLRYTF